MKGLNSAKKEGDSVYKGRGKTIFEEQIARIHFHFSTEKDLPQFNKRRFCLRATRRGLFIVLSLFFGGIFLEPLLADLIFLKGGIKNENSGPINFDMNNDGVSDIVIKQDGKMGLGTATPKSTLEIMGSLGFVAQMVSDNVTLSANTLVLVDTSGGNITLTMPSVVSTAGRVYQIKKMMDANELIVTASVNIDKASTIVLTTSNNGLPYVNVFSNGTQWYIRSKSEE